MPKKIKNWTVTAKTLKKGEYGLIAYSSYLMSQRDHEGQEIKLLGGRPNLYRMIREGHDFNARRKLSKGGRPSNYAWSIALSYPFQVDNERMKHIYINVMSEFYQFVSDENGLDLSESNIQNLVKTETLGAIHRGEKINNHVHILVQKHFKPLRELEGNAVRVSVDLSKKKYLHRLKLINNSVVHGLMGNEIIDYKIEDHQNRQQKRMNQRAAKRTKSIEEEHSDLLNDSEILLHRLNSAMSEYEKMKECGQDIEALEKRFATTKKQIENGNTKRAEATLEKAEKAIGINWNEENAKKTNNNTPKPRMK